MADRWADAMPVGRCSTRKQIDPARVAPGRSGGMKTMTVRGDQLTVASTTLLLFSNCAAWNHTVRPEALGGIGSVHETLPLPFGEEEAATASYRQAS